MYLELHLNRLDWTAVMVLSAPHFNLAIKLGHSGFEGRESGLWEKRTVGQKISYFATHWIICKRWAVQAPDMESKIPQNVEKSCLCSFNSRQWYDKNMHKKMLNFVLQRKRKIVLLVDVLSFLKSYYWKIQPFEKIPLYVSATKPRNIK